MPSSEQIRESIEARIGELRSEKTLLEAARAALTADGAPRTSAPTRSEPRTKPIATPRKRRTPAESKVRTRRKAPAVLFAGTLETMLRGAKEGLNAVAITQQAGARDSQVRDLLRELERTGRVRRTGVGRGSRWKLITDEERIAERAAELEALSRPQP